MYYYYASCSFKLLRLRIKSVRVYNTYLPKFKRYSITLTLSLSLVSSYSSSRRRFSCAILSVKLSSSR
jgi:hypothetical protein